MKRILSFCLALLMVLGTMTFSVFAEDAEVTVDADVQAVADAITAEMLTQDREPGHLVTKNLDMSLEGDITLPEGVSVTFASSDTAVIANDGTVKRTSTYDGEATVTATVSKEGSATVAKELKFTVLKTETTILMSDNFYYSELRDDYLVEYNTETSKIVSNLSGWTYSNCTASNIPTNVETKIKSYSDGYAIDYKRLNTETGKTVNVKKTMDIVAEDTDIISLNMTGHMVDWGGGIKRIDLILYATTTAGVKKFGEIRFSDSNAATYTYDEETADFKPTSASNVKLEAGKDRKIEIKIDYAKKTYVLYMNGTQVGIVANIPDYTYTEKLDYFTMDIIRQNLAPVELLIKDMSVTTTAVSAIRYEELTSQSPNAITQNLSLPTEVGGKTITWVSSNPSAIATDGTVTRGTEEQDVTLTAKVDGEEDNVFNFSVLSTRVSTKHYISTENFEGIDAYQAIWGTGNGKQNGVAIDGVKDANLTFTQTIVDKGEDGGATRALYLHRANEDQTGTCYGLGTLYKVGTVNGRAMYTNGLITIKSQLCFDFKEGETPRYSVTFYERGNVGDVGDKVVFNYATGKVGIGDYSYTGKLPARGEWFDLEIMIDMKRKMTEVFIDGVSVVGHEMELANSSEHDYYGTSISGVPGISGIFFNCNTANTGMYMDNLALYAINDEEYYSDVSEYGMYTNKEPVTDYDFSLAVVGDIQKVTYHWPEKVPAIYNWIAANAEEKNIVRAISLGDITEKDTKAEYDIVKAAFSVLDGVVPHTIVRGNHDVANFDANIPYEEYKDTVDGSYIESMRNTYNLFEQGGRKYMLLNLDCGAKDADLEWANEVVAAHPDYNVIVATHLYMYRDGRTIGTWYGVEDYGQNGGTTIWDDFVKQHENIVMVLCGHISTDRVVMNERIGVNGNVVKELLINPQATDMFYDGTGMVTMLYFSEDGKNVQVENYSTTYESFYRKDCQFEFELAVIEPELAELSIGEIAKDSEKITFTVTGAEASASTSVIAAIYNANMKLIAAKKYVSAASVPAEFTYDANAKFVKAFYIEQETLAPKAVSAGKTIE